MPGATTGSFCVEKGNHSCAHSRHVDDLGKTFEKELEDFFVNYRPLSGKADRILGVKGPGTGAPAGEILPQRGCTSPVTLTRSTSALSKQSS